MHIVEIPKGNGKTRRIYCPNNKEKATLRSVKGEIERRVRNSGKAFDVMHGFVRGRSPVSNAIQHIGYQFTLTMDLKDFFDSVTAERLKGKLSEDIQAVCLVDGAARQGLPTSPAVANLAAVDIDNAILNLKKKRGWEFTYTRYADDLTISYNDEGLTSLLLNEVKNIVTRTGFQLAEHKTHVYAAKAGRRIITGVAVDEMGVYPTRAMKRRLRAARHQNNGPQANGLQEWCKLKPPSNKKHESLSKDILNEVRAVAAAWNLRSISSEKIPSKGPDIILGEGCRITGDPVLMLGMSTFTSGWRSCHTQPDGSKRRGPVFWMHTEGTRIAALFSDKMIEHGGVARPAMLARTLVHRSTNGNLYYDRIYYSDEKDACTLRKQLVEFGVRPAKDYKFTVVGCVSARFRAFFDTLRIRVGIAENGPWKGKKVHICFSPIGKDDVCAV